MTYTRGRGPRRKLGKVALQTYTLITSSGLVNDEIINWLESLLLEPQADEIVFLGEIELLQKELRWHLTQLQRALAAYLNEASPHDPSYGRLKELAVGL